MVRIQRQRIAVAKQYCRGQTHRGCCSGKIYGMQSQTFLRLQSLPTFSKQGLVIAGGLCVYRGS